MVRRGMPVYAVGNFVCLSVYVTVVECVKTADEHYQTFQTPSYPVMLVFSYQTRRALGGVHAPPTKVFRRLTASVNETIVKPRVDSAGGP